MPFPLSIGAHTVAGPPELAALAQGDADGPGGTVVEGQRPAQWVMGLVASGDLERRLAIGLGAALLQHARPATVAEGARLAEALHPSPLSPLVVHALSAHDTLLLLQVDPARPDRSVEDTLLRSAVAVADLRDQGVRGQVLERLRHAGLPELEAEVLLEHGTIEELRRWVPALRSEGLSEAVQERVRARVARGDDGARWLGGQGLL